MLPLAVLALSFWSNWKRTAFLQQGFMDRGERLAIRVIAHLIGGFGSVLALLFIASGILNVDFGTAAYTLSGTTTVFVYGAFWVIRFRGREW